MYFIFLLLFCKHACTSVFLSRTVQLVELVSASSHFTMHSWSHGACVPTYVFITSVVGSFPLASWSSFAVASEGSFLVVSTHCTTLEDCLPVI